MGYYEIKAQFEISIDDNKRWDEKKNLPQKIHIMYMGLYVYTFIYYKVWYLFSFKVLAGGDR